MKTSVRPSPLAFVNDVAKSTHDDSLWLVTGVAGFIGSHLAETLLKWGCRVRGIDNFSTGSRRNLDDVQRSVGDEGWRRFEFLEGSLIDLDTCRTACAGADIVLHQAALGSVPRSIADPLMSHHANVTGHLNMLVAARDARVRRFVYAASSSTYGDHPGLPKVEHLIGNPLSPYAVTKYVNELYAGVFARTYGLETIGLRYFNVFGPRQDPNGAYAAVIPRWISAAMRDERAMINGDGETSRDFTYVGNVVDANLLAATTVDAATIGEVYNIAAGECTTLNALSRLIRDGIGVRLGRESGPGRSEPEYGPFRTGDVRHSQADVSKAQAHLGYVPRVGVACGIEQTLDWYVAHPGYVT